MQMDRRTERLLLVAAFAGAALIGGCNKPGQPLLPMPAASTATGNVADIDVTENVKTALQRNDLLKAFDIGVVTLKGDVRLKGVLDNQSQIDEAIRIARATEGAHTIHDELTLKK
jgi:osmotically-inducible protein OsmY